jgi:MAF protein
MQTYKVVLASSSEYRKQLLEKLPISFIIASPEIDEIAKYNESLQQLARRLAIAKAQAVQDQFKQHLIIASDQVAILDGRQLTKPGGRKQTIEQLEACSSRSVDFYTSICLLDSASGKYYCDLDKTTVYFKELSKKQIIRYVDLDRPYDCAGGFKVEGLGIALFERIQGEDPNALIGLPTIKLINLFEQFGVTVL